MSKAAQEIAGIEAALDRLETSIKVLKALLAQATPATETAAKDDLVNIEAEVEIVEALTNRFAMRISGEAADSTVLEPLPLLYARSEPPTSGISNERASQYLLQAQRWVQKSRAYISYLGGVCSGIEHPPKAESRDDSGATEVIAGEPEANISFGRYVGRLLLEPQIDGRLMRLAEAFSFVDAKSRRWPVPKGTVVDGASIPQALWSVIGGPFEGKYRDASVIHDYYCSVRLHPWQEVHRLFHDAMRASGVSVTRAKVMYAAVYFAGPRWSHMDSVNTALPRRDESGIMFSIAHSRFEKNMFEAMEVAGKSAMAVLKSDRPSTRKEGETQLHLDQMERIIEDFDPTLAEIDRAIDEAVELLEWRIAGERVIVSPAEEGAVQDAILFQDATIEAAIRLKLQKPVGPISKRDMEGIVDLSLSNREVQDLADLRFCTSLQILSIENTPVSDLSPIGSLFALEILSINGTSTENLFPIKNLTNLREIFVGKTRVADISPLTSLTGLRSISLAYSPVAEIKPLLSLCKNGGLKNGSVNLWGTPLSSEARCVHIPMLISLGVEISV